MFYSFDVSAGVRIEEEKDDKRKRLIYAGIHYGTYLAFAKKLITETSEFHRDLNEIFKLKMVKNRLLKTLRMHVDEFPELQQDLRLTALYYLLSLRRDGVGSNHQSKSLCELRAIQSLSRPMLTTLSDYFIHVSVEDDQWSYYKYILRYEQLKDQGASALDHMNYQRAILAFMKKSSSGTQKLRMFFKLDWRSDQAPIQGIYREACGLLKDRFSGHHFHDTQFEFLWKRLTQKGDVDGRIRLLAAADRRSFVHEFFLKDDKLVEQVAFNFDQYAHLFSQDKLQPLVQRVRPFTGRVPVEYAFAEGFSLERASFTMTQFIDYLIDPSSCDPLSCVAPLAGRPKDYPFLFVNLLETFSSFPYRFEGFLRLDSVQNQGSEFHGALYRLLEFCGGSKKERLAHELEMRCIKQAYQALCEVGLAERMAQEEAFALSSHARQDRQNFYAEKAQYFLKKEHRASAVFNFFMVRYYVMNGVAMHCDNVQTDAEKQSCLLWVEMEMLKCFIALKMRWPATAAFQRGRALLPPGRVLDRSLIKMNGDEETIHNELSVYQEACFDLFNVLSDKTLKLGIYFRMSCNAPHFPEARLAMTALKLNHAMIRRVIQDARFVMALPGEAAAVEQQRLDSLLTLIKLAAAVDQCALVTELLSDAAFKPLASLLCDEVVYTNIQPPNSAELMKYFSEKCQRHIVRVLHLNGEANPRAEAKWAAIFSRNQPPEDQPLVAMTSRLVQ